MLTRSGYLQKLLRDERQYVTDLSEVFLDNQTGWSDNGQIDTGIPDDRDSLLARIAALETQLQEVTHADH